MENLSKYDKSILVIVTMIPIFNQLNSSFIALSNLIYVPYILIILAFFLMKKNNDDLKANIKMKFTEGMGLTLSLLFLSYIVSPVIGMTFLKFTPFQNIIYIGLFLIFICVLAILYSTIKNSYMYQCMLKCSLIGNSLVLFFNIAMNINQIFDIKFNTIITNERGARANYGFSHPNTTAIYILVEILLIYLIYIKEKRKLVIPVITIGVLTIFMISTGSRTSIMSLGLFIGLSLYSKCTLKVDPLIKICINLITIMIVILFIIYKFDLVGFISNTSGRGISLIDNIKAIGVYGNYFTGIGPTSIMILGDYCKLNFADNWYIVQVIQFGLISLGIIIISIIRLCNNFRRHNDYLCLNLMLTLLFYSLAERVLIVPGVMLSWVCWMIFMGSNYCHKVNNK